MEALLRARLELTTSGIYFEPTVIPVTENDLGIVTFGISNDRISDFSATTSVVSPASISKLDLPRQTIHALLDSTDKISLLDIELGVSRRELPKGKFIPFVIPKYKYILDAAMRMSPIKDIPQIAIIQDNYIKEKTIITFPEQLPIGSKYRLFLDDVMVAERFFPYDLGPSEILEELVFLDIIPGHNHVLRVDTVGFNKVLITDMAINDQFTRGINDISCSFEFR